MAKQSEAIHLLCVRIEKKVAFLDELLIAKLTDKSIFSKISGGSYTFSVISPNMTVCH